MKESGNSVKRKASDDIAQQQSMAPSQFDLDGLPLELKIETCIKVGIITLLDAAFRVPAIQSILQTDYFWQRKLAYDFPELIEFVGASLPEWATVESSSFLGQSDASDYLPFGPWRRYYYTARYFMRLIYKALIKLAMKWAPICNAIVTTLPQSRYYLERCRLVSKSTNMVSVFQYPRNEEDGSRGGRGSAVRSVMDIRAFCAKYLLYDVVLSHEYDTVKSWKDPWHYGRRPQTVNPIRLLMIQIAAYERLTRNSVFNSAFVNFFADRRLNKFMGWIFHLNPVFDPYAASDTSSSSNARDSVWTREIDAPTVIPPNETLEESTTGARRATMFLLWAAMEYSMQEPGELRMKEYDKSYLRLRASYLGLPRDERGRILIGSSVTEDAGLALASAVTTIDAPVAAAANALTSVFNLEEAALDNDTQLHLSVAASKGMHVMVMAVKDLVPAETHPNTDQLIWVMDGSALLTFFFPQTTPTVLHLEPGDAYLIQRGVKHQIQNTTPKDEDRLLRLVTIYSPGKPE